MGNTQKEIGETYNLSDNRISEILGKFEIEVSEILKIGIEKGKTFEQIATTKEVEEYLDKPKSSVLDILNNLKAEGFLKKEKLIRGSGRPSWIWKIR